MKVFIYATEGIYQGLHGIYAQSVVEVDTPEEAEVIAWDLAGNLVDEFGLEEEYEESGFEPEFDYSIYRISDEYAKATVGELEDIACNEGHESFIKDYCVEEID